MQLSRQQPGVLLKSKRARQRASLRVHVCTGVLQVPMAEFGLDGSLSPVNLGDATMPSEEAAGRTPCEASVLNGECACVRAESVLASGSPITSGDQAGVETSSTSVCLEGRPEMPRRSSIIKVCVCVRARALEFVMQNIRSA